MVWIIGLLMAREGEREGVLSRSRFDRSDRRERGMDSVDDVEGVLMRRRKVGASRPRSGVPDVYTEPRLVGSEPNARSRSRSRSYGKDDTEPRAGWREDGMSLRGGSGGALLAA